MNPLGVSVICSTNRLNMFDNLLENFNRQNIEDKELIVVLNYLNPNFNNFNKKITNMDNIKIYSLHPNYSLGQCLNLGISKSKYPLIAKFDDDDYYGPMYLADSIQHFNSTDASVVGKATTFVYFVEENILAIRNLNNENKFVNRIEGSTIIFKRDILDKISFHDKNLGEDMEFCKDCIKNGFKIFSTNKDHFVYIRNNNLNHTWRINNQNLIKNSKIVCSTSDFKDCLTWC